MLVLHPLVTQGAAGPPWTAQGTDAKCRTAEGAPWGSSSQVSTTALLALNKGKTLQVTCRSSTIKYESILKKYSQEFDHFIYSRMISGSTHDSHFYSPFSSFFWTISWLILQIKHRSSVVFFFLPPRARIRMSENSKWQNCLMDSKWLHSPTRPGRQRWPLKCCATSFEPWE